MTDASIDVLKCSAAELTTFLMARRFDNDGVATTAFLLEGTASLPNADEIAEQLMGGEAEVEVDEDTENEEEEAVGPYKTKQPQEKETVVALVSSHSEESAATANAASPKSDKINNNNILGAPLHKNSVELSLTNPRGKFHLTFHEDGLYASTVKNPQSLVIPKGAVRNAIVFPKPTDCQFISSDSKKATITPMVLLCFHDSGDEANDNDEDDQELTAVTFKDKPLSQICFALPLTLEESLECALKQQGNDSSSSSVEDAWMQLLSHSLDISAENIFRIANPNITTGTTKPRWTFQSYQEANTSSTAGNLPFVKTYFGVQDGCLFPMEEGLLFFKPPLFLPRSKLASIACGRGTGASSRYVDMHVTLDDETALEFSNISREELSVLNQYIHSVLIPAMQRDSNDDEKNSNTVIKASAKAEGAHQNSDEESDTSVEVVKVKEGRGGRPKRAAACDAAQQTKQHYMTNNDDEDDEDSDEDEAFGMDDASEKEASSDEDDEDFEEVVEVGTSKGGKGKNQRDDDSDDDSEAEDEADDDDDDDVIEVDIAETDTEEEDDDDEEASPPPSKKSRS